MFSFGKQILELLLKNSTKYFSIQTELTIDPSVPEYVNNDITRLQQVLINILINAYKFTIRGYIKISVKMAESDKDFDEILVQIEDTGIGVDPNYKKLLFKEANTFNIEKIDQSRKGYGLTISNNIINRIGRKIGYKPNKQDKGSIFYFTFINAKNQKIERGVTKNNFTNIVDVISKLTKSESSKSVDLSRFGISLKNNLYLESESIEKYRICKSQLSKIIIFKFIIR